MNAKKLTVKRYCCPHCGATDTLATIEQLIGTARAYRITRGAGDDPQVDHAGSTDIEWDRSMTIGVTCTSCEWRYAGDDWPSKLADADPDCPHDGTPLQGGIDTWWCPKCDEQFASPFPIAGLEALQP